MASKPRFLRALLDFSFRELMTERPGGVYGVAVAGLGIVAGAGAGYGFARHPELGLLIVTGVVAGFVVSALVMRLWVETAVVLGRIADQAEEIAEQLAGIAVEVGKGEGSAAAAGVKNRPS